MRRLVRVQTREHSASAHREFMRATARCAAAARPSTAGGSEQAILQVRAQVRCTNCRRVARSRSTNSIFAPWH
jgi:hypothetical protein